MALTNITGSISPVPDPAGQGGKYLYSDGTNVTYVTTGGPVVVVAGTAQTAVAGSHYVLTNVSASTLTLPAAPVAGDTVMITWSNTLTTNTINRNGNTIMGLSEDMTLDAATNGNVQLRFVNSSWRVM